MDYRAIQQFVGVLSGVEVLFRVDDEIAAVDAEELNLADKPDIAEEIVGP